METLVRCVILSWMMGVGCKALYETTAPLRSMRYTWLKYMVVPTFAAGFMLMAYTRIPAYILQPVRLVLVVSVIAQIYFRIPIGKNLALSLLHCGIYWIVSMLLLSAAAFFVSAPSEAFGNLMEAITGSVHLCLMLLIHDKYKNRFQQAYEGKWWLFSIFPLCSLVVVMAISMLSWGDGAMEYTIRLAAVFAFALIQICILWFMGKALEREKELQQLRLAQERARNQMELYQEMQRVYELQQRKLHDYKNQLKYMLGMLDAGQAEKAREYISGLAGGLKKSGDYVNTNHAVVNVILNQKYQEAWEKGITMVMSVNDLSGITIKEEELVVLLMNLLDNAIEACKKLEKHKVIQVKLVQEEEQLVLSVGNPVKETVNIQGKRIITSKADRDRHGIGLLNVDSIISKNQGTSALRCENGWFYFSAMIPL